MWLRIVLMPQYSMPERLGQHFLTHRPTLSVIADALELTGKDTAIEVGPGHGELTRVLLEKIPELHLVAIEKDTRLAETLRKTLPVSRFPNFVVIEGDVRKELSGLIAGFSNKNDFKIAGNIPYYLTGYLFRLLGDLPQKPTRSVFMIQQEVAKRIVALPPHMNLLAATLQIWATPKIILKVPAGRFSPPPKVDSAVIVLNAKLKIPDASFLKNYFVFVRNLFRQPRKTILNNLVFAYPAEKTAITKALARFSVPENSRPQDLGVETVILLLKTLGHSQK